MTEQKPRELVIHTKRGPDGPHLIYELAECHPDFFTKEETWHMVEKSQLTRAQELLDVAKTALDQYTRIHDAGCSLAFEDECDCLHPEIAIEALAKIN